MAKVLLLSNGNGEDLSGSLLGLALQELGHVVQAFPLVGHGKHYLETGINVEGRTKEFAETGFGYLSFRGRLNEIFGGQFFYVLARFFKFLEVAVDFDLVLVVGDILPILFAWFSRRSVVVYLVAYSSHYEGHLQLPWPCKECLSSKNFLSIYSRDQLTADDLTRQLGRPVVFLGNPFMDMMFRPMQLLPTVESRVGVLPGSRRPELDNNILMALRVIECFPLAKTVDSDFTFDIALVSSLDDLLLEKLVTAQGWQLVRGGPQSGKIQLIKTNRRVNIHRQSFVEIVQSSDVLLSMAGTATEQAAGLGKPIVQLIGRGPQFTSKFAEAQRRLLGPAIFIAHGNPGANRTIHKTALLLLYLVERRKQDLTFKEECLTQAKIRLGDSRGGERISQAISDLIDH